MALALFNARGNALPIDKNGCFFLSFVFFPLIIAPIGKPQVQRLIADDKEPINFKDLRKHTQYYGGFHDNHRVISWLWDILDNDFSEEEKRLFLKVSLLYQSRCRRQLVFH